MILKTILMLRILFENYFIKRKYISTISKETRAITHVSGTDGIE